MSNKKKVNDVSLSETDTSWFISLDAPFPFGIVLSLLILEVLVIILLEREGFIVVNI